MSPQDALARLEESYASITLVVRHYLSEMAGKPAKATSD